MTNNFTGDLIIIQQDDWRKWTLGEALSYLPVAIPFGQIVVPKGFVTDGASIPQFLWDIMPTWGRYSRAAVVHDYLYSLLRAGSIVFDRKTADAIFYEAMVACGVNTTIRFLIWLGVRLFGQVK